MAMPAETTQKKTALFTKEYRERLALGQSTSSTTSKSCQSVSKARITVVVRKRPVLALETARQDTDIVNMDKDLATVVISEPRKNVHGNIYHESHEFKFDRIYPEHQSNFNVYTSCVRPLVEYLFEEGTRCSCFAFGQTNSGKTYTMVGRVGKMSAKTVNDDMKGIVEFAAQDIFKALNLPLTINRKLVVSFFEIYCNRVYDLLNNRKTVKALETKSNDVVVKDLKVICPADVAELCSVISLGFDKRVTATNSRNAESSRGHAVMTLSICNAETEQVLSKLAFIDLAGSERGADTINSGRITQTDGAGINKSLLALKECIRALDAQSNHVPFRDSELTKVLKDMFVGEKARTLMIANVSPTASCCEQTLNTIRYADRLRALRKNCLPDIAELNCEDDENSPRSVESEERTFQCLYSDISNLSEFRGKKYPDKNVKNMPFKRSLIRLDDEANIRQSESYSDDDFISNSSNLIKGSNQILKSKFRSAMKPLFGGSSGLTNELSDDDSSCAGSDPDAYLTKSLFGPHDTDPSKNVPSPQTIPQSMPIRRSVTTFHSKNFLLRDNLNVSNFWTDSPILMKDSTKKALGSEKFLPENKHVAKPLISNKKNDRLSVAPNTGKAAVTNSSKYLSSSEDISKGNNLNPSSSSGNRGVVSPSPGSLSNRNTKMALKSERKTKDRCFSSPSSPKVDNLVVSNFDNCDILVQRPPKSDQNNNNTNYALKSEQNPRDNKWNGMKLNLRKLQAETSESVGDSLNVEGGSSSTASSQGETKSRLQRGTCDVVNGSSGVNIDRISSNTRKQNDKGTFVDINPLFRKTTDRAERLTDNSYCKNNESAPSSGVDSDQNNSKLKSTRRGQARVFNKTTAAGSKTKQINTTPRFNRQKEIMNAKTNKSSAKNSDFTKMKKKNVSQELKNNESRSRESIFVRSRTAHKSSDTSRRDTNVQNRQPLRFRCLEENKSDASSLSESSATAVAFEVNVNSGDIPFKTASKVSDQFSLESSKKDKYVLQKSTDLSKDTNPNVPFPNNIADPMLRKYVDPRSPTRTVAQCFQQLLKLGLWKPDENDSGTGLDQLSDNLMKRIQTCAAEFERQHRICMNQESHLNDQIISLVKNFDVSDLHRSLDKIEVLKHCLDEKLKLGIQLTTVLSDIDDLSKLIHAINEEGS